MTTRTMQRTGETRQAGRTRYVFAGTGEAEQERELGQGQDYTKVCPRCGQTLFADQDVCYDCLYDFSRNVARTGTLPRAVPPTADPLAREDPLTSIELDEIDDDVESAAPRHRREEPVDEDAAVADAADDAAGDDADATVDLARAARSAAPPAEADEAAPLALEVSTPQLRLCVPVPPEGLGIGRSEGNDIVLRAQAVSRSHVRVEPRGTGLLVRDCGATNPATAAGRPIEESVELEAGERFEVCGTSFAVRAPAVRA